MTDLGAESGVFARILSENAPECSRDIQEKLVHYFELVVAENRIQNLTRLSTPQDFYFGHIVDVLEFVKSSGNLEYPAYDLGSGAGVPGLVAAILEGKQWVLSDSEKKKAEFLVRAASFLSLSNVSISSDRAEVSLAQSKCPAIVARAVGKVEKLYGWIEKCSTWNKMVLFKGPNWDLEWNEFKKSKFRKRLLIDSVHEYKIQDKTRKIVYLSRVPRGTK